MTDDDEELKPLAGGNMNIPPKKPPVAVGTGSLFPDSDDSISLGGFTTCNQNQWVLKKVQLLDVEFRYWERKSGSSIFVDRTNLDNVTQLKTKISPTREQTEDKASQLQLSID